MSADVDRKPLTDSELWFLGSQTSAGSTRPWPYWNRYPAGLFEATVFAIVARLVDEDDGHLYPTELGRKALDHAEQIRCQSS